MEGIVAVVSAWGQRPIEEGKDRFLMSPDEG